MNDWVNVKERKPDPHETVLIDYNNGIACARCSGDVWYFMPKDSDIVQNVTHWQYTPLRAKND